jgi:hypothetical protein
MDLIILVTGMVDFVLYVILSPLHTPDFTSPDILCLGIQSNELVYAAGQPRHLAGDDYLRLHIHDFPLF